VGRRVFLMLTEYVVTHPGDCRFLLAFYSSGKGLSKLYEGIRDAVNDPMLCNISKVGLYTDTYPIDDPKYGLSLCNFHLPQNIMYDPDPADHRKLYNRWFFVVNHETLSASVDLFERMIHESKTH
jgi:hypothetical protein